MPIDPRGALAPALLLLVALGCLGPGPAPPRAASPGPRTPLPPPAIAPVAVSRPDASVRPAAVRLLDRGRFTINVQDADLPSVLLGLGRESPLNIVVEPGITGRVTADLKEVTLLEILDQVVLPRGYHYAVERNLLRIFTADRQTRTYRVDYPNYTRKGNSDLTIAGAISARPDLGTSGGGGAGEDVSAAGVQTTQTVDFWSEVEATLKAIVLGAEGAEPPEGDATRPGPRVLVSRQSALVTVTAESDVLRDVERYLAEVARATAQQVLIDAKILEVTLSDDLDLGLDIEYAPGLGEGAAGVFSRLITPGLREAALVQALAPSLTEGGFSFGLAREKFGVVLEALARQTDVRVVSTPRITTLNNHKALIKVVRNEVFFIAEVEVALLETVASVPVVEFVPQIVPIGVTLDVTPQVSDQNEITLHIHPSVSEVVDIVAQPQADAAVPDVGSLPVIDLRETDTVLRVADGSTIVIGGLIQSRELDVQRKIPLLGEIPWLGAAFRNTHTEERRTELLILLTPTVLDAPRITRVSEEALASLDEVEALRHARAEERPWWRRPFGRSYGVR